LKAPETGAWRRTSPFAILFFMARILRLIARNAWQSLAPLFALLVAYQGDLVSKLKLGGVIFAVATTTLALLSYWFFRYRVGDRSILIRQGVIKKKQLDIQFDRIQGINTQQNPVYRLLGLVTVSFDTAGSAGSEGNLPAVSHAFAGSLRARIGNRRAATSDDTAVDYAAPDALLRLDWRDMVRIGLADRRALILFAVLGPLFERLGDNADEVITNYVERAADGAFQFGVASGVLIVAAALSSLILLLAVISIAAALLRYHRFELWLDGSTLRSRGGLLTRHEHAMDLSKIQTLRLEQGIVQRLQKRFRMTARQAMASGKNRRQKIFTIPVVTAERADHLRLLFLQPEAGRLSQDPAAGTFMPVSPCIMRSRVLYLGLLPALLCIIGLWMSLGPSSLLFLLWPVAVAAGAYRSWKRAGYAYDDDEIVRRSGWLGHRTVSLLFRKVQRVTISQSPYQRRKRLASLRMYMASGSVRIPYIKHATAERLRDYILYKVESSHRPWY